MKDDKDILKYYILTTLNGPVELVCTDTKGVVGSYRFIEAGTEKGKTKNLKVTSRWYTNEEIDGLGKIKIKKYCEIYNYSIQEELSDIDVKLLLI